MKTKLSLLRLANNIISTKYHSHIVLYFIITSKHLVRDLVKSEKREEAQEKDHVGVCESWRGRVRRNISSLVKSFHIKYIFGKTGLL